MRDYRLPIPELKKIEPILTEYFGYKRAMFENELLATYYHEYPNGISEDICIELHDRPFISEHYCSR